MTLLVVTVAIRLSVNIWPLAANGWMSLVFVKLHPLLLEHLPRNQKLLLQSSKNLTTTKRKAKKAFDYLLKNRLAEEPRAGG